MFSGIIEEMGVVKAVARQPGGVRLALLAKRILDGLEIGESVAVNGACLTVAARQSDAFEADLSPETLQRTTAGQLVVGDGVNLERSLRYNGRVSGHLVSGHVDGVGRIRDRKQEGNALLLTIEIPKELRRYCAGKGSIAVDGVSLTINAVGDDHIAVSVIPHTAKATTLGVKGAGAAVNLEADLMAKYLERLLTGDRADQGGAAPKIDLDYLKRQGLL
ncbi:MAG: riboflavin synthase [Nitrospirae bacterium]|nr:riboflavin synthase [Nitrospirota bacterium]